MVGVGQVDPLLARRPATGGEPADIWVRETG